MAKPKLHPKRLENPSASRPKLPRKELDALVRAAWKAGWWCQRSGKNYILCYPPDDGRMVRIPSTPSSMYTANNVARKLRRRGVDV